jgi:hypothetical protein
MNGVTFLGQDVNLQLLKSLKEEMCIFFGAGLSYMAGYKSWSELANTLNSRFWEKREILPLNKKEIYRYSVKEGLNDLANNGKCKEVFSFLQSLDEALYVFEMKNIFSESEERENQKIWSFLQKLTNQNIFFITTNIDRSFEKYMYLSEGEVAVQPEFSNPPKKLNYLHGRLDKERSWVFTTQEYDSVYYRGVKSCDNFLKYIYNTYNVLFIGYGLAEEDIMRPLKLELPNKTGKSYFWLEGISGNNSAKLLTRSTNLKNSYNIDIIPYDIETNGYEEIYRVLDDLYKELFKERI